ncbi:MAG: hypothetical protein ACXVFT_17105 [Solirubrobacteraceae bacterium]
MDGPSFEGAAVFMPIECEHAFVSIKGSPYARFRRSLQGGQLATVLTEARELPPLELDDALEVLVLMARAGHPSFDRAAARWVGRLIAEQPLSLADARYALALVERLPACAEALRRLTGRR